MTSPTRSQGAVLFARIGSTQADLAKRLGVSTGIVAMWMSGQRLPSPPNRKMLFEVFRIPPASWDVEPEAPRLPPSVAASRPDDSTISGRVETLEALVTALMQEVTEDSGATMHERAKVMSSLSHTLSSLRRLKGEDVAELKVQRHPKWIELRGVILGALEGYPDALDAVIASLESLEKRAG